MATTVANIKDVRFDVFSDDYDKDKYVYCGRPSKFGNPFTHVKSSCVTDPKFMCKTRKEAIAKHREWLINGDGQYLLEDLHELKDKILVCWCKPALCHGDTLAELVNNKFHSKRNSR